MPSLRIGERAGSQPQGHMPLMGHLRELRNRLLKVGVALALGAVAVAVFFEPIWNFLREPYCRLGLAQQLLSNPSQPDGCGLVVSGIFEGFKVRIQLALILGLLISSPVWIYQLWAFVAPGLHRNERRYTYGFMGAAVPLFLGGATVAYFAMTKGLVILIGLIPEGALPLITISEYFKYVTVVVAVFGFSFLLPLLVTVLNLAGVLSHERLAQWRRWIIFGTAAFAALATPPDPVTMLALAVPMAVLMEVATLIAWFHDRRQAKRSPYRELDDDETSPLDLDDSYERDTESRS